MNRREFLKTAVVVSAVAAVPGFVINNGEIEHPDYDRVTIESFDFGHRTGMAVSWMDNGELRRNAVMFYKPPHELTERDLIGGFEKLNSARYNF